MHTITPEELAQRYHVMMMTTLLPLSASVKLAVDLWWNACEGYMQQEIDKHPDRAFYNTETGGLLVDIFYRANQQRRRNTWRSK